MLIYAFKIKLHIGTQKVYNNLGEVISTVPNEIDTRKNLTSPLPIFFLLLLGGTKIFKIEKKIPKRIIPRRQSIFIYSYNGSMI